MNKSDQAVSCFSTGCNCAQAVFSAYAPDLGLDRETALKIASGFGGGMGCLGEVCGAVTGAFMAIGLRHGHTTGEDAEAKEHTYGLVQEFAAAFTARHGTITCRDLLGRDIDTPERRKEARDKGLFSTLCPELVRDAAELVEPMLK